MSRCIHVFKGQVPENIKHCGISSRFATSCNGTLVIQPQCRWKRFLSFLRIKRRKRSLTEVTDRSRSPLCRHLCSNTSWRGKFNHVVIVRYGKKVDPIITRDRWAIQTCLGKENRAMGWPGQTDYLFQQISTRF